MKETRTKTKNPSAQKSNYKEYVEKLLELFRQKTKNQKHKEKHEND
jgi:hypothetical protein